MNITAVCPSLLAPLVPLAEMEIIERGESTSLIVQRRSEFLFIFVIGEESINMKHSRRGMRWLDKRFDLDKNLDGAGIMYLRV